MMAYTLIYRTVPDTYVVLSYFILTHKQNKQPEDIVELTMSLSSWNVLRIWINVLICSTLVSAGTTLYSWLIATKVEVYHPSMQKVPAASCLLYRTPTLWTFPLSTDQVIEIYQMFTLL